MTVPAAIRELDKIEMARQLDGVYRLDHAKPRACESKGKIERFHQKVDSFIEEVRAAHVHTLVSAIATALETFYGTLIEKIDKLDIVKV